jgi:hypothetical protein
LIAWICPFGKQKSSVIHVLLSKKLVNAFRLKVSFQNWNCSFFNTTSILALKVSFFDSTPIPDLILKISVLLELTKVSLIVNITTPVVLV